MLVVKNTRGLQLGLMQAVRVQVCVTGTNVVLLVKAASLSSYWKDLLVTSQVTVYFGVYVYCKVEYPPAMEQRAVRDTLETPWSKIEMNLDGNKIPLLLHLIFPCISTFYLSLSEARG